MDRLSSSTRSRPSRRRVRHSRNPRPRPHAPARRLTDRASRHSAAPSGEANATGVLAMTVAFVRVAATGERRPFPYHSHRCPPPSRARNALPDRERPRVRAARLAGNLVVQSLALQRSARDPQRGRNPGQNRLLPSQSSGSRSNPPRSSRRQAREVPPPPRRALGARRPVPLPRLVESRR